MADEVTGTVDGDSENVAVGRGNRQSTDSRNQRSGDQNVTFSNSDNLQLWFKLLDITDDVRGLRGDVRTLDIKIDGLPDRVGRLEKLEVVVRPEVPHPESDSLNLSVRMIFTISFAAFLVVIALVGFLIYLQLT